MDSLLDVLILAALTAVLIAQTFFPRNNTAGRAAVQTQFTIRGVPVG